MVAEVAIRQAIEGVSKGESSPFIHLQMLTVSTPITARLSKGSIWHVEHVASEGWEVVGLELAKQQPEHCYW